MMKKRLLPKKRLITLLLLFSSSINMWAHRTITPQNRPLVEVLEEFSEKYQVFFSFDGDLISEIEVDFTFREEDMESAIDRLLNSTQLSYKYLGAKYYVIYRDDRAGKKSMRKLARKIHQIQKIENGGQIQLHRNVQNQIQKLGTIAQSVRELKEKTITGVIQNQEGQPLVGASVQAKGTTRGVLTDSDFILT